jgi:UDP-glucose 4-epimerase
MRILITGAAGLVARALVRELEAGGHELTLLDRVDPREATVFSPGETERRRVPLEPRWPYLRAEITDPLAMRAAARAQEACVHLAAAVTGEYAHGAATMHANVCGTYAVIDACRLEGVRTFACASSINAFGTFYWRVSGRPPRYDRLPLGEDAPVQIEDPYSLSKHVNELTCAAFTRAFAMTTAAFRFAGVVTDEQWRRMLADPAPTTAWADDLWQWVHLDDVAAGIRRALECATLPGHGVYTLGAGDTRAPEPTMDLLERFRPELARTLARRLEGREPLLSIAAARAAFGYAPRFRLDRRAAMAAG